MPFRGQSTITVVLPAGQDNTQQAVAFGNAGTTPINVLLGGDVTIGTLTGNLTLADPTGMIAGDNLTLHFTQDATGGRAVTLPASFKGSNIASGLANTKLLAVYKYDGTYFIQTSNSGWGFSGVLTSSLVVSSSRVASLEDADSILECNSSSPILITIQPEASTAFKINTVLTTYQVGTGASTFIAEVGVTFQGVAPTAAQYTHIGLRYRGSDIWAWI